MQLVAKWREAWKWNSMQAFGVLATVPLIWNELPKGVTDLIPEQYRPIAIALIALIGAISRLRKQA